MRGRCVGRYLLLGGKTLLFPYSIFVGCYFLLKLREWFRTFRIYITANEWLSHYLAGNASCVCESIPCSSGEHRVDDQTSLAVGVFPSIFGHSWLWPGLRFPTSVEQYTLF